VESNSSYDVVVLVKHGLYKPWIDIARKGQEASWLAIDMPPGIKIIHFYGIPVNKFGMIFDRFHEKLRRVNKATNYLLKFFDSVVAMPLKNWVPKTKISNFLGTVHEEIQCNVIDIYFTLKWKQIAAYKYILDNLKFKYLYETNGSSYVNLVNLQQFLKTLPHSHVYAGLQPWEEAEFISGASRITS